MVFSWWFFSFLRSSHMVHLLPILICCIAVQQCLSFSHFSFYFAFSLLPHKIILNMFELILVCTYFSRWLVFLPNCIVLPLLCSYLLLFLPIWFCCLHLEPLMWISQSLSSVFVFHIFLVLVLWWLCNYLCLLSLFILFFETLPPLSFCSFFHCFILFWTSFILFLTNSLLHSFCSLHSFVYLPYYLCFFSTFLLIFSWVFDPYLFCLNKCSFSSRSTLLWTSFSLFLTNLFLNCFAPFILLPTYLIICVFSPLSSYFFLSLWSSPFLLKTRVLFRRVVLFFDFIQFVFTNLF